MSNSFFVRIETLGCRLNQTESEALAALFFESGFSVFTPSLKHLQKKVNVNLCIVNTCTVTEKAEQKARRLIRFLLKEHEQSLVLVTGCYAELEANAIEKIDERVIVFSGKKKDSLSELPAYIKNLNSTCAEASKNKKKCGIEICGGEDRGNKNSDGFNCISLRRLKTILAGFKKEYESTVIPPEQRSKIFKLSSPLFLFHSRASLKIQDGCNNACAFCRIRLARGKAVSLPAEEALVRLQKLERLGVKEAVISGVNLSQYSDNGYNFAKLLELFLSNTVEIKLRISSLYPETITEEILPVLKHPRICPHFHLSIQSGSNAVLKRMKRRYSRADIYKAVNLIRSVKIKPFLGCDIITGFPGEDAESFNQTYSMCSELKFAGIHAFPFSPRPGTEAFNMTPKIPERIASGRTAELKLLAEKNYTEYLKLCEGEIFSAIVEKPVFKKPVKVVTENYLSLYLTDGKKNFIYSRRLCFSEKALDSKGFSGGEQIKVQILNNQARLITE